MKALFFLLVFLFPSLLFSQMPLQDSLPAGRDSSVQAKATIVENTDSIAIQADSLVSTKLLQPGTYQVVLDRAFEQSRYLNTSGKPAATVSKEMPARFNEALFYLLLSVVMFLAVLRFFFERYFNNLFRVFFNTSLRQSQLTDQLLQAKQVSLFFNLLFAITGGLYIYFLLQHFNWLQTGNTLAAIGICVLCVALIYLFKYLTLKFTGWLTGYNESVKTYLFIIFLINKILGILLIPFVIVIAFGAPFLQYPAILVSLLLIGLMFLLRFLRSYGLLRKDIKVSRLHFFIYIAGIEIIPLLLIYKALMILLNKNL